MLLLEALNIPVKTDTKEAEKNLEALEQKVKPFAAAITGAFENAVTSGQALGDVLRSLALDLSKLVLQAALNPLQGLIGGGLAGLLGGGNGNVLSSLLGFAKGGVFEQGRVQPFAKGGVVAAPSFFPMTGSGGLGLMGEAGPEAIMPLARGPDGRLGIRGGQGGSTHVSVTIQARDAESFRRSEGHVSAMLARAVSRGQRNL